MAIKSSSRAKRSKAENESELAKIRDEIQQQKMELNPKVEELAKLKESEIRESVQDLTVDSVLQKIGTLGSDVSRGLSELSARLVTGTTMLQSLRDAVQMEKRELERLHKIDVAATALDQLVEEHSQKKIMLEREVEELRSHWAIEQAQSEKEQKEFDDNLKKLRTREKDEYEYQKALERKKDQDEYQETMKIQDRKNKEKQESLEKSWALRENTLKQQEDELLRLKKENIEFPEVIKKEIHQAVNETTKALEAKHRQDLLLGQKDIESEKQLSELKIKSLEDTVTRQFTQIELLGARLEEAKNQVQDIAIKAIEGASGARALSHVNQIAMEQAKTRTPQT